jgi:hypothetical protein
VLELAVASHGRLHGNVGKEVSVIVDYPSATGRSTADSYATGDRLKRVRADPSYRQYRW